ncbi:Hypothetical Protein FCC1311_057072 [Hondaea fermentalgiana]|uniref:Uncharacterized protein n=1 Tax=Hondaea fermentalgiana TaxID=2315210 RepID=A0A2R5GEY9_9STRA|nr:Hypothetical Protein FCC1311_057072 [Hondaea fermentalgiana]|eukprot:GBG29486.1 Hypothetical Protein FCC1311_057072 [Hondaea fermentalgiana]
MGLLQGAMALALLVATAAHTGEALTISLNEANFTPPAYVPASNILGQHKGGMRSTNVIALPASSEEESSTSSTPTEEDNSWKDYWIGLTVAPIVIFVFFLLWFIGLCCQPFCKFAYRKDAVFRFRGFIAFCILCLGSLIVWICCFAVDSDLQGGISSAKNSLVTVQELLEDWDALLADAQVQMGRIEINITDTQAICIEETSDNPDARTAINAAVNTLTGYLDSADAGIVQALGYLSQADALIDGVLEAPAETVTSTVILTWGLVMFFLVLFLFGATSLQYLNPGGAQAKRCKRCLVKTSCLTIFTIGLFFIALSILIASALHAASTVGADVCGPNPDFTFQRLISEDDGSPMLETRRVGAEAGLCEPIPNSALSGSNNRDPPGLAYFLCFYQTCQGETVVLDILDEIGELANSWTWPSLPSDTPAPCVDAYDALMNETIAVATDLVLSAVELFRCDRINPIYTAMVHDTFCNKIVSTSITAWKYSLSGSVFLLLAMGVQRHFYLGKTRDHVFKSNTCARRGAGLSSSTDFDAGDADDEDDPSSQYCSNNTAMLAGTPRTSLRSAKAISVGSASPYASDSSRSRTSSASTSPAASPGDRASLVIL